MRARRLAPVLAAASLLPAVSLLAAGCGGTSRKSTTTNARTTNARTRTAETLAQRIRSERRLPVRPPAPGCSTAVAAAPALPVRTALEQVAGAPFGVAVTPDGRWSFVDLAGGRVGVFSDARFAPRLVRTIKVSDEDAVGNSITHDGRDLLVTDGNRGATVVSVSRAETGAANAVLGTLTPPAGANVGQGSIEVASSPDGHYAFVSIEYGGGVTVYNLGAALADHFHKSGYVGLIRLGQAVVGSAVSPDGRWLYATSEAAAAAGSGGEGTLSVISISTAARDPARSVVATIPAHCAPVRVAVSADGSVVWVTARESDQLLAFSATKLLRDPSHSLLAAARVGEAPVGLAIVDGGRDIVVADSNRFEAPGATTSLMVINTSNALARRPAVVGTIATGAFPREMALEPNHGTLLVGDFGSSQFEAVSVAGLP